MRFMADAPTTTLQRLKGITTGSLPTFIDVGSNFATPEINEDNIIDQLIGSGQSAVLLGDNTWSQLFPKRFVREYSFPSFDIFDLDSVDQGINKDLHSELKKDDWSLLIAHYLGVDHCGHKHGPNHPEMARKLGEMNKVIEDIVETMDDDTTLYVIGDHGMTSSGDHGGDSEDEVTAMMFAHTKKSEFLGDNGDSWMEQIDLVPSLAATFGVPMPFSNLGSINFDIVPDAPVDGLSDAHARMLHLWANAKQLQDFFSNYTAENRGVFAEDKLDDFNVKFYILSLRMSTMSTPDGIDGLNGDVKAYLQKVLHECRDVWVKFDPNLMSQGLLFLAVVNVFIYLLVSNLKASQFEVVFNQGNVMFIYASNGAVVVATYVLHRLLSWDGFALNALVYSSVYSIALIAFLLIQNWDYISLNWSQQRHFSNMFPRTVFIASAAVFFSNSFVVQEQKILCYLVSGSLVVFLYKIRNEYSRLASWRKLKPELILATSFTKLAVCTAFAALLLRGTYSFHRCREEQPNCTDFQMEMSQLPLQISLPSKFSQNISITWMDLLSVFVLAVFVTVSRRFLRKCGNLSGFSSHVLIARYLLIVSAIACGLHSLLKSSGFIKNPKSIWQMRMDALAWIVYTVFLMQLSAVVIKPLMVFVLQKEKRSFSVSPFGRVVPQIVMKMKQMYEEAVAPADENDGIPVVYGLATVYSSVFLSSCVAFALLHSVLLGSLPANGLIAVLSVAFLVLVLNAILRYQRCTKLGEFMHGNPGNPPPNGLFLFLGSFLLAAGVHVARRLVPDRPLQLLRHVPPADAVADRLARGVRRPHRDPRQQQRPLGRSSHPEHTRWPVPYIFPVPTARHHADRYFHHLPVAGAATHHENRHPEPERDEASPYREENHRRSRAGVRYHQQVQRIEFRKR